MLYKSGLLFLALLIGTFALPTQESDMSIFFDHTDPESRIVGGTVAGEVPHMVALTQGVVFKAFFCGGSLLTNTKILTAAHCVETVILWTGNLMRSVRATVGTNRWRRGGTMYDIVGNITHPHYVSSTLKNDIGILVTSSNIALTNNVQLVALDYNWIPGGVPTRVNGWGSTRTGGSLSAVLLELLATTVEGAQCQEDVARRGAELNIRPPPVEPHIELCTFRALNQGACNGDSGSALVLQSTGKQIGVVSWGLPCARGAPDMFARVSAYEDWIESSKA